MIGLGAILFSLQSLDVGSQETTTVAEGAIYTAAFILVLGLNFAFIAPGMLLLQPVRLWRVWFARWKALTPRQHFRGTYLLPTPETCRGTNNLPAAIYPRSYNPSFGLGACVIAVFFTATLAIIFPLMAVPLVILVALTLIAHRYLVGYVYGRIDRGQTGGLLQLWLIKRFATMLALQPLLLGLILLAFRQWALAGVLLAAATIIILLVEIYTYVRLRQPGVKSLNDASHDALQRFTERVKTKRRTGEDDEKSLPEVPDPEREGRSVTGGARGSRGTGPRRTLASMASMLDMIADTLAVPRSAVDRRTPVPLRECAS